MTFLLVGLYRDQKGSRWRLRKTDLEPLDWFTHACTHSSGHLTSLGLRFPSPVPAFLPTWFKDKVPDPAFLMSGVQNIH